MRKKEGGGAGRRERERERRSKNAAAAAAAAAAAVECKPLSFTQKRKRTLTLSFSVPNSDARCSAMVGEKGDDQEWTLRSKPSLFEEDFCEESFRESDLPFFFVSLSVGSMHCFSSSSSSSPFFSHERKAHSHSHHGGRAPLRQVAEAPRARGRVQGPCRIMDRRDEERQKKTAATNQTSPTIIISLLSISSPCCHYSSLAATAAARNTFEVQQRGKETRAKGRAKGLFLRRPLSQREPSSLFFCCCCCCCCAHRRRPRAPFNAFLVSPSASSLTPFSISLAHSFLAHRQLLMRRNSVYVAFILGGAMVGERVSFF